MFSAAKNQRPVLICETDNSFIWGRRECLNRGLDHRGPLQNPLHLSDSNRLPLGTDPKKPLQPQNPQHPPSLDTPLNNYFSMVMLQRNSSRILAMTSRSAGLLQTHADLSSHQWSLEVVTWVSPQAHMRSQSDRSQHSWSFGSQTEMLWNTGKPQSTQEQSLPGTISTQ